MALVVAMASLSCQNHQNKSNTLVGGKLVSPQKKVCSLPCFNLRKLQGATTGAGMVPHTQTLRSNSNIKGFLSRGVSVLQENMHNAKLFGRGRRFLLTDI